MQEVATPRAWFKEEMNARFPALTLLTLALAACGQRSESAASSGSLPSTALSQSSSATSPAAPAASGMTTAAGAGSGGASMQMSNMHEHAAVPTFPPGTQLASTVLPASQFQDAMAQDAYLKARDVADRLDKMYCYCHCHEHSGHKSLLTCFQTDHAAECGICQKEAIQAWLDWKDGLTVDVSQRAADFAYNQGQPPPSRPQ